MRYKLLSLLDENPELSQRELAKELGISLGKTNYCLKALVEKGWVKTRNFRNSSNKRAYLYKLTPAGVREKAYATRRFLALKLKEHVEISSQIEKLRNELRASDGSRRERDT